MPQACLSFRDSVLPPRASAICLHILSAGSIGVYSRIIAASRSTTSGVAVCRDSFMPSFDNLCNKNAAMFVPSTSATMWSISLLRSQFASASHVHASTGARKDQLSLPVDHMTAEWSHQHPRGDISPACRVRQW